MGNQLAKFVLQFARSKQGLLLAIPLLTFTDMRILMVGLDAAGKTTILYLSLVLPSLLSDTKSSLVKLVSIPRKQDIY
jgi:hypothetical protein